MRFPRLRELTLAQQAFHLRHSSLVDGEGRIRSAALYWDFTVRPSVVGRRYAVHVEYRQQGSPTVIVRRPDLLQLAGDRRLPHVYSERPVRLCLYLPAAGEWHRGLS